MFRDLKYCSYVLKKELSTTHHHKDVILIWCCITYIDEMIKWKEIRKYLWSMYPSYRLSYVADIVVDHISIPPNLILRLIFSGTVR